MTPPTVLTRRNYDVPALLSLCGAIYFWRLGANGLFDLDEGLYVSAAREMHLSGDFVTLRIHGVPFYDKPPLVFWAAAGCMRLFGQSEWAARLPSALACTLLALLVYYFGRRLFDRRAGLIAGAMVVLSPLMGMVGRQLMLDAMLCLWVAVALAGWFCGELASPDRSRPWYLLFWLGCALGVLTKGLPGVVLPLATVFTYLVWTERGRPASVVARLRAASPVTGIFLFVAIVAPWHFLVWRASPVAANGGNLFVQEYLIHHHLQRFEGKDFGHNLPFFYFVPVLLVGFFPWSAFLPFALARSCREDICRERRDARRFALCWTLVTFGIFSITISKCEVYILPMFAGAALLGGEWCARALDDWRGSRRLGTAYGLIALLAAAGIVAASLAQPIIRREQVPWELVRAFMVVLGLTVLLGAICLAALRTVRGQASFALLVAGTGIIGLVVIDTVLPCVQRGYLAPLQELATRAGRLAEAGRTSLAMDITAPRRPSVLFYVPDNFLRDPGRPMLENGVERGGTRQQSLSDFVVEHAPAYVLTSERRAADLARDRPVQRIDSRTGWVILLYRPRAPSMAFRPDVGQ
jgi:4-amino-4-deoxy-L-arabinose transferase-like glycosyltransferase